MPLESCMILLDTSPYMRNSDYIPTRLAAQADAANLLASAVLQNNNESTVGIAAAADVLVSPTAAVGKLLTAVHATTTTAAPNSSTRHHTHVVSSIPHAVAVASLALKHRRNKLGSQRVVCFVGTPVTEDVKALQTTGRMLRKNNVVLDVVGLGEHAHNAEKLQALVDAANGSNTTTNTTAETTTMGHYVPVPEGVVPSDVLASSPILGAAAAVASTGAAAASAGFADFGGVDPNMDPELAMALRVSMEEERARQERAVVAAPTEGDAAAPPELSEDEALLQQALAMSMNENEPTTGAEDGKQDDDEDALMEDATEELDEDAATQMALQMSMQNDAVQDPEFVQGMLDDMKDDGADDDKKDDDKQE